MPAAADFLLRCIERAPPMRTDAEKARYTATVKMLADARASALALDIKVSEPHASVLVDGAQVGTSPLQRVVFVEPGVRRVVATRDGFEPAEAEVKGNKGDGIGVVLTLRPLPPRPEPVKVVSAPPPLVPLRPVDEPEATSALMPASGSNTIATRLLASGAGVSAVAGVVFLALAGVASADQQDTSIAYQETGGPCGPEGCGAPDEGLRRETMRDIGIASFVAAGVFVAGSTVFGLWPHASKQRASGQRRLMTVALW
jgi:hypothetical protein